MAAIGLPVPPGFTITTEMCTRYYTDGGVYPESLKAEVANGIAHIEGVTGKKFGDKADPLLVSVRRSEDRSVGDECIRTCRSRWSPSRLKKKYIYCRDNN